MVIWTLAKKELRLLGRDRRSAVILIAMPLGFILILGLLLGENFGQKPDDRLRVSVVDLDQGFALEEAVSFFANTPSASPVPCGLDPHELAALGLASSNDLGRFPHQTWSKMVLRDLAETAGIRVEIIDSRAEAEQLVAEHRRAAILIFEPGFSHRVARCSFLVDGINPFHRDGVYLDRVDATLLKDDKQPGGAAIIEQVAQVSLLRVILPWMIGRAFERMSDPAFIEILGKEVNLPVPVKWRLLVGRDKLSLNDMLMLAAGNETTQSQLFKRKVGSGVQNALREQFKKYELTGKTWAALTKSIDAGTGEGAEVSAYTEKGGSGFLHRGAARYQLLVPSYTVLFAFCLVMTVGWLFVAERRQGTLKRLRAAPIGGWQILLGKLLPCFLLSLGQGMVLLIAGRLVFGMRWGPLTWSLGQQLLWLLPVVFTTSMAAMGLAVLVAALARNEVQVALYGGIPVVVFALIGGCVLPLEMMPEQTQQLSLLTPHGWALAAYRELLDPNPNSNPNLLIVSRACLVLAAFGIGFLGCAWTFLRLDG
jgi:ABC-type multidrug transport system permease subunit